MLDPSLFSPDPLSVLFEKFGPEGEMIPDHNDGSKSAGTTPGTDSSFDWGKQA
jgi:hypothetical protein